MNKKIIFFVGLVFCVSIISGCGQNNLMENKMEKELEKNLGGKADVDMNNGGVKIETEQGSIQVGGEVSLPKDFPTDIYVIDGKLVSAMKNVMGAGFQVAVQSNLSMQEIKSMYQIKLKEQGWVITNVSDLPNGTMVSGQKGKRQVVVAAGIEENVEGIMVMITSIEEQVQ